MTEAVYHAVSRTKTWCGMDLNIQPEGGNERPMPLVAPDRDSVTCEGCLAAMPPPPALGTKVTEVVKDKLEAEQRRFEKRKGARPPEPESGIDPTKVAARAKRTIDTGG